MVVFLADKSSNARIVNKQHMLLFTAIWIPGRQNIHDIIT